MAGDAEPDELDALLDAYTAQAEQENKKLESKAKRGREELVGKVPMSMSRAREEALQQPIDRNNKGFKLLAAMGYKEGSALGRATESASGALTQPLPLELKEGRAGLGVDEQRKREREQQEQQAEQERVQRQRTAAHHQQRYQAAVRTEYGSKQIVRQLRAAWRLLLELDRRRYEAAGGKAGPGEPLGEQQQGQGDGGGVLLEGQQRLLQRLPALVAVLAEEARAEAERERRRAEAAVEGGGVRHGRGQGQGDEGLEAEGEGEGGAGRCGGVQREESVDVEGTEARGGRAGGTGANEREGVGGVSSAAAEGGVVALPLEEQLRVLLTHLRAAHCYCFFCGCGYADAVELEACCPGLTEEEH